MQAVNGTPLINTTIIGFIILIVLVLFKLHHSKKLSTTELL